MSYKPSVQSKFILDRALAWVQSVSYQITARWVFYRLLQDGTYSKKAGYRHLLGLLSKARKGFYGGWRPDTLADDTRSPILMQRSGLYGLSLRGWGFQDEKAWRQAIKKDLNCPIDRWAHQPVYAEILFEAAAMQGQFLHYADENLPLLAFHGDVSIPEKWRTARRLADRWLALRRPIHIYYYGDLDPKGLQIPQSAWEDIELWTLALIYDADRSTKAKVLEAQGQLHFHRVGINKGQEITLGIPDNPERPGTYQWEALADDQAENLIGKSAELLDQAAFDRDKLEEDEITARFRQEKGE